MEFNEKKDKKLDKKVANLVTYIKVKKLQRSYILAFFILNRISEEVIKLLNEVPDPKKHPEAVRKFKEFLRQKVDLQQKINEAAECNNSIILCKISQLTRML